MNSILLAVTLVGATANEDLVITPQRSDTTIRVERCDKSVIVDIQSKSGIGQAVVRRKADRWPRQVEIRLHLRGLESFQIECDQLTLELGVSSTDPKQQHASLRDADQSQHALEQKSPYWTQVRIEGSKPTIPLPEGYFSVVLPGGLLEKNPELLKLSWVDFFRN